MTCAEPTVSLRLHRLRIERATGSSWATEGASVSAMFAVTGAGPLLHLIACPDAAILVTSLWQQRPYGARGQLLRVTSSSTGHVRLETLRPGAQHVLGCIPAGRWADELAGLAEQVTEVLHTAGERGLDELLEQVLIRAAPPLGGRQPTC